MKIKVNDTNIGEIDGFTAPLIVAIQSNTRKLTYCKHIGTDIRVNGKIEATGKYIPVRNIPVFQASGVV